MDFVLIMRCKEDLSREKAPGHLYSSQKYLTSDGDTDAKEVNTVQKRDMAFIFWQKYKLNDIFSKFRRSIPFVIKLSENVFSIF